MTRRQTVQQLARGVRALPDPPPPAVEPRELAREMTQALAHELAMFRKALREERPDPSQPPPDWYIESLMTKPAGDVSFYDLERLARVDPALCEQRWREVKEAARSDAASGWMAARAVEPLGGNAWSRATFLALRDRLRQAWQPRHEGEAMLLDEMAQYELLRQKWLGVLAMMSGNAQSITTLADGHGPRDPQRPLRAAEQLKEALRLVERLQRLVHQAMQALMNLRRGKSPVFVGRVQQVNVAAGPQQNLQVRSAGEP